MDQTKLGGVSETTQECPVSRGRRFNPAAPQNDDLLDLVRSCEGFDQFEDGGGGGDEGAEDRDDGCEPLRAGDGSQLQ